MSDCFRDQTGYMHVFYLILLANYKVCSYSLVSSCVYCFICLLFLDFRKILLWNTGLIYLIKHFLLADMLERIAAQDESAEENSPNIFNFLLPVLCHWSADDKTRKVLLDEDIHITLWEYLEKLLCCHATKSIVYQSLETVFGIFLNIAITEAELAADSSSVFAEILVLLMTKLNQFSSMPANVVMNMVTLSLILARAQVKIHQKNKEGIERFFQMILKMLCDSCPYLQQENTSTKQINWSDISELWLIGIDNMIACIDLYPGLSEVLKTHSAFQAMVKFLERKKVIKTDDFKSVSLIATNFVKKVM